MALRRANPMAVRSREGDELLQVECDVCGALITCARPKEWRGICEASYLCTCGQKVNILWSSAGLRERKAPPRKRLKPSEMMVRRSEWVARLRNYLEEGGGPMTVKELATNLRSYFGCLMSAEVQVRRVLNEADWAELVSTKPKRFQAIRGLSSPRVPHQKR